MRYGLYFVAFIVFNVLLTIVGITLPGWIQGFGAAWFFSYIFVQVMILVLDVVINNIGNKEKDFDPTNKQALIWSFWLVIIVGALYYLSEMVLAFFVLAVILIGILMAARRMN